LNPPECLLKISGIDKTFPGVKALTQASLSVYAGQAMALIGENGAGKSTLMKVLTGIYTKDAGSIEYLGREVAFRNPRESQQAGISIIHQELNLIGELSIADVYVYMTLRWAKGLKLDVSAFDRLTAYFDRVGANPGVLAVLQQES